MRTWAYAPQYHAVECYRLQSNVLSNSVIREKFLETLLRKVHLELNE